MMGTFYGMGLFGGGVMMFLFWGAVIWLIVYLVKDKEPSKDSSPLDILKERYAKGEIQKKEFEEIKKELIQK